MSSLLNKLEEYFNLLITKNYTSEYLSQLKSSIINDITESDSSDELSDANEFIISYYEQKPKSKDENLKTLSNIATYAAAGIAFGASIGLFANNVRLGALLGPIVGIEINGLKHHYHLYQIKTHAVELEKIIGNKIEQLDKTPSLS